MADSGEGTGFDASAEGTSEAMESGQESFETSDSELYDPGYDPSEYEQELTDFSYEETEESGQEANDRGYDPSEYEQELTDFSYEETEESGQKLNDKGEPVGKRPEVAESYFLKEGDNYYEDGIRSEVDWESFAENSDEKGFDKNYPVENHQFSAGDTFCRYGSERGRYATEIGTKYSELSLPYDPDTQEYGEYRVCKPVDCEKGRAARNFGQEGEGIQYLFSKTISDMIKDGTIERLI